jgi:hypothetical protein
MDVDLSAGQAVLGALVITVLLVALHLAAPRIRRLPLVPEAATGSFAGGLAVAYVFLHLLPEIAEGNEAIGEALSDVVHPSPLLDLGIFVVALVGFTAFLALERLADRHAPRPVNGLDATPPVDRRPTAGVYRLQLGSFVIYNALITYTMPLRLRTGVLFALLFTLAMGLHFVLTDRSLEERYGTRFGRTGRLILAGALLLGWAAAALAAPTSALLVALLTALLGGSILLNVFKRRFPPVAARASAGSWPGWCSTPGCWPPLPRSTNESPCSRAV